MFFVQPESCISSSIMRPELRLGQMVRAKCLSAVVKKALAISAADLEFFDLPHSL